MKNLKWTTFHVEKELMEELLKLKQHLIKNLKEIDPNVVLGKNWTLQQLINYYKEKEGIK